MTEKVNALDHVFHFLAGFPTPQEVMAFEAGMEDSEYFDHLMAQNKKRGLSDQETKLLDDFILAERYVRFAKAKALLLINKENVS